MPSSFGRLRNRCNLFGEIFSLLNFIPSRFALFRCKSSATARRTCKPIYLALIFPFCPYRLRVFCLFSNISAVIRSFLFAFYFFFLHNHYTLVYVLIASSRRGVKSVLSPVLFASIHVYYSFQDFHLPWESDILSGFHLFITGTCVLIVGLMNDLVTSNSPRHARARLLWSIRFVPKSAELHRCLRV